MTSATKFIVPPSGFAGNAQQTGATQLLFAKASGARGGRTTQRRRRKAKASKPRTRKTKAKRAKRSGGNARVVKGSAAAKRHMASIRRKRRR